MDERLPKMSFQSTGKKNTMIQKYFEYFDYFDYFDYSFETVLNTLNYSLSPPLLHPVPLPFNGVGVVALDESWATTARSS